MTDFGPEITNNLIAAFASAISEPRFKRYYRIYPIVNDTKVDRDKIEAIAIYMWNLALCEALYTPLNVAEIVFRNALNDALVKLRNTPVWYEDPFLLTEREQALVVEAQRELMNARKPIVPTRIIAELPFGFWVSLYSDTHLSHIVHPTIKEVFPNLHPRQRTHQVVQRRLQQVRDLRNRVFHHEPIWHWADLNKHHDEIVEMIGWVNRTAQKVCVLQDRFQSVHDLGWQPYRQRLDAMVADEVLARMIQEESTHSD